MTYNATHRLAVEKALQRLEPGDFFLISNGMTWNRFTFANLENAAIRAVSRIPFGHAAIYMGGGQIFEMPIARWKACDLFAKDNSNGAAFVRCKELTRAQRGRIKAFTEAYYEQNKWLGKLSYDAASLFLGGFGETGTLTARGAAEALGTDESIGKAVSPFTQAPATAASILLAMLYESKGRFAPLSCSAFITYSHAVANHQIQDRGIRDLFSYPTHCTPGDLWDIVIADKRKYDIEILDFTHDLQVDTVRQVEGVDTQRWAKQMEAQAQEIRAR